MALLLRSLARQGVCLSRPQYNILSRHVAPMGSTAKEEMNKFWAKNARLNRPMSPHLTIYKYMVSPHVDVDHTQRNWSGAQWSHFGLRCSSAGVTWKLPILPGFDQLIIHWPLPHWVGQVRHRLPRIVPHLQRHTPLVVGYWQRLQDPRGLPHWLHSHWFVRHHLHSFGFDLITRREVMSRGSRRECGLDVLLEFCLNCLFWPKAGLIIEVLNKRLYYAVHRNDVVIFVSCNQLLYEKL